MNVLVINGSPKGKKSNTYQLTCAFLEGMRQELERTRNSAAERQDTKGMQVEEIQVNRLNLKPCLGCFSCWEQTPGRCCIQDDMQKVIQKLLWADVTIWSFPLYYYTVPGALKILIDRQLPMMLPFMTEREDGIGNGSHPSRYDMSNKRTVLISTCGFYTAEGNYDGVYSLFDHMCGRNQYTAVFCGQGELFRVPELAGRTGEYLEYVKEAGREYTRGVISRETGEKLKQLLFPKEVFENMADANWGINKDTGEKESDVLIFTRQMAALYRKESYEGKEQVLEMYYTDSDECYQIVMGEEGSQVLTEGFKSCTTRIETPITVWRSIAAGEIRGDEALMKHLYRVKGDFNLMLHWDRYFGSKESRDSERESSASESQYGQERQLKEKGITKDRKTEVLHMPWKETNMNIMLIPWIVFWIAVPLNGFTGALAGSAVCVLVQFLFCLHKKTMYDYLTGVAVTGFSIALLAGLPEQKVVPLSYLAFGLMWTGSCFSKIPLSAHYSINQYGGESALENPLFMKTNWILTLIWGILYLLTPIWTYVLMGSSIGSLTGAVNFIAPVIMGIFTAWFQKWYPAKVARG